MPSKNAVERDHNLNKWPVAENIHLLTDPTALLVEIVVFCCVMYPVKVFCYSKALIIQEDINKVVVVAIVDVVLDLEQMFRCVLE